MMEEESGGAPPTTTMEGSTLETEKGQGGKKKNPIRRAMSRLAGRVKKRMWTRSNVESR
jgi:hypothetical protein